MSEKLNSLVYAIRYEALGVVSVELRPATPDVSFPPAEPGAHIDLQLPGGLVRSYSLCEIDNCVPRYVVAVFKDRASRGGSRYIHEELRVGSTLLISEPRNNFQLSEGASGAVLVAGGIGITPIYAMLQRLRQIGGRPRVFYCARTRAEAAFLHSVRALAGADRLTLHFDDEAGGPPDLRELLAGFCPSTHFYCCGPSPMLAAYEQACADLGYEHVHLERFAAPAGEAARSEDGDFEIELQVSRQTLRVPADKSILQVLLSVGIDVDHSCEEGICGSCETAVVDGDIDHRDCILSAAERAAGDTMMVCVSRCKGSRLILAK